MDDPPAAKRRGLTAASAQRIACEASIQTGLNPAGLRRLGPVGDNATFVLPREEVVLRITSITRRERVERELAVARWLSDASFPVVRPFRPLPLVVKEHLVTVWEEVPDPVPASPRELGSVLRNLHVLVPPPDLVLPRLDPLSGVEGHLRAVDGVDSVDAAFLRRRLAELRSAYSRLEFALAPGPVHGDAHRKNVIRGTHGRAILLDLERFSNGPREWDLVVAAVYERLRWYSPEEYSGFAEAYGVDIRQWPGFSTLAAVRELHMTAWLCARVGREPHLAPEARRRVASLRNPSAPRRWTPGT